MKILYDEKAFLEEGSVAALGTFDGVHIGHQELIRNAVTLARSLDARCVVCTFDGIRCRCCGRTVHRSRC